MIASCPPNKGNTQDIADRRWIILQEVQQCQRVGVTELGRELRVSEATIRRDLEHLEAMGLLHRIHGGAQAVGLAGPYRFDARLLQGVAFKEAIGRVAARRVRPGSTVLLDSGSTVLEIARHLSPALLEKGHLTVITRSLVIANEFRHKQGVRLILLGGLYLHNFDTFVGVQVRDALHNLRVDVLFTGTDGITIADGSTTDNLEEVELHAITERIAEEVVLVTDASKIGVRNLQVVLPMSKINVFITDERAPGDFLDQLRQRDIEVIVAAMHDAAQDKQPAAAK
jgi:DeoR/GlpR family transcriptional regulator of sugar metabolism